jgi:hypothetical protein
MKLVDFRWRILSVHSAYTTPRPYYRFIISGNISSSNKELICSILDVCSEGV